MDSSEDRMARLVEPLRQMPDIAETLPDLEGQIVRAALEGQNVHEIAQALETSEAAVWELLGNVARYVTGQVPDRRVETGGMGSDTDPGVTGGYGETALGSLESESTDSYRDT
ncbi:MAG: hypothetical protein ACRDIB_19535 [Ardenticatenaceae bacterium]